jgi:hypothetical protein
MATYRIYDVQQKLISALDALETPAFYSGIEFDIKFRAGLLACPQAVFIAAWEGLRFASAGHDDLPMFAYVD